MGHQMAIYASNFKKLGSFDIGKVWPIRISRRNLGDFRRFWAISGDFRKKRKIGLVFFCETCLKSPWIADFLVYDDEFEFVWLC